MLCILGPSGVSKGPPEVSFKGVPEVFIILVNRVKSAGGGG
jgi:hypothetical protein